MMEPHLEVCMSRAQLKDEVFMNMALELSRLGTCCRLQVGAVLLRGDGGVAAAGFNGALPGMAHCTPKWSRMPWRSARSWSAMLV